MTVPAAGFGFSISSTVPLFGPALMNTHRQLRSPATQAPSVLPIARLKIATKTKNFSKFFIS